MDQHPCEQTNRDESTKDVGIQAKCEKRRVNGKRVQPFKDKIVGIRYQSDRYGYLRPDDPGKKWDHNQEGPMDIDGNPEQGTDSE